MQIIIRQPICQLSRRLAGFSLAGKLRRYLPDSLYLSLALAGGLLWLALCRF